MKLLATSVFAVLLMLSSRPACAEELDARDINDFVSRIAGDVAGYLKQAKALEVAVVPFKNSDQEGDFAFSEVLTNELLQELRFTQSGLKVLLPAESGSAYRVTGTWKIQGEDVHVTTRVVKMPAGEVQVNFAGTIPLKRVPKVYVSHEKPAAAVPDKGTRIAIMDFAGFQKYPDYEYLKRAIPEAITTVFARNSDFVLIERLQLDKIQRELAIAESRFADPDAAVSVGKLLNANYVIIGSFQKAGRKLRFTARRVKVETGEIFEAADITGSEDEIFELEDTLAKRLLDDIQKYR